MKKTAKRRGTSKRSNATRTSPHLKLSHRRHTGHLMPRRTTSYPTLAMIMLCLGVFLAGWTHFATADSGGSYVITARVLGTAPTQPATIDTPTNGTVVTSLPLTVSGTCPQSTYVTLYRNGAFSGVALCSSLGTYSIQTGLFLGVNQLQVRDFNLADVPGPLSNIVSVTYKPPSGLLPTTTGTTRPTPVAQPLLFKTIFVYQGHYIDQPTTWQLDIEGGTIPYAVSVDWGDGYHGLISRPEAGEFSLSHTYKRAGGYRGSYVVNFSASDAAGAETFLQMLAIVNNPPAGAATIHHSSSGNLMNSIPGYLGNLIRYVWPTYILVILLLTSFWLGERREYYHLKPRLRKTSRA